jgi:hypothetical protein
LFVRYWHIADNPTAPAFVAYWTNNGQKAALEIDLSAAIDPKRTLGVARNTYRVPASYVAQYNFCRVHEAHGSMTPAMSLGIADHMWSLGELIDAALAQVPPDLGRRHKKPSLTVIDREKL